MKPKLALLIVSLLTIASAASAVVDPADNSMGFYFDTQADIYEYQTAPYVSMPVYLLATNATFDALYGYEFGYEIDGNYMLTSIALGGTGPISVGCHNGNCIVGLAAPMLMAETNIIATFSIFVMDDNPIQFLLRGAVPSAVGDSRFPAVLLEGNILMAMGLSAWDDIAQEPAVCAAINPEIRPVTTNASTWESVKSHYR